MAALCRNIGEPSACGPWRLRADQCGACATRTACIRTRSDKSPPRTSGLTVRCHFHVNIARAAPICAPTSLERARVHRERLHLRLSVQGNAQMMPIPFRATDDRVCHLPRDEKEGVLFCEGQCQLTVLRGFQALAHRRIEPKHIVRLEAHASSGDHLHVGRACLIGEAIPCSP